jgi:hypothetical protein
LTAGENWAGRAAELGWNAATLFGCRRARPLDHPGGAGLLWAIKIFVVPTYFPPVWSYSDKTMKTLTGHGFPPAAGYLPPRPAPCAGFTRELSAREPEERDMATATEYADMFDALQASGRVD